MKTTNTLLETANRPLTVEFESDEPSRVLLDEVREATRPEPPRRVPTQKPALTPGPAFPPYGLD